MCVHVYSLQVVFFMRLNQSINYELSVYYICRVPNGVHGAGLGYLISLYCRVYIIKLLFTLIVLRNLSRQSTATSGDSIAY